MAGTQEVQGWEGRVPEPALVRGFLVLITAIIAQAIGHNIDVTWIEWAMNIYTLGTGLVAAVLIRPKVTPTVVAEAREEAALYTPVPEPEQPELPFRG